MKAAWVMVLGAEAVLLGGESASANTPSSSDRFRDAVFYQQTCNQCHEAQAARKYSDRQWNDLMHTMQTRTALNDTELKELLSFLQATN